mgnify:FL=1
MTPSRDDQRVFLAVPRQGTLSGARAVLKPDPSTVGRKIARLERALSAPLFLDSPQGYVPTEAGEWMPPHAAEVAAAMARAEDAVRGQTDRLTGTIRVGAPDGCVNFLLPQVMAPIAAAHPELELQVVALPGLFDLNRREAEMAIGVSAPAAGRLAVQRIGSCRLVLAGARHDRRPRRRSGPGPTCGATG